jgi:hypothetical protein
MIRTMWMAAVRVFRRPALPLAAYYAVTLVLPLANGAAQSGAPFVDHALVVLVVPPLLIALAWAVHHIWRHARGPKHYPAVSASAPAPPARATHRLPRQKGSPLEVLAGDGPREACAQGRGDASHSAFRRP